MAMRSANGKEVPRYRDGVFFIRLGPLESAESITPAIVDAIGFRYYEGGDSKEQLLEFLRHKQLLLVMDNFEHLLEGAPLLTEILENAPQVRALVTTRERLNLGGEVIYPLGGMRFPEDDELELEKLDEPFSAIELFSQRASQICPDFSPNSEDMRSIARICRLVEGMPLGIELAATWMEMLSPEEIASEIQGSLDFLESERRDVPERHRSIRAVFDHTWKLITDAEQEILKKASVFRGGFTTEAAREVTGASLKQLMGLVNKSLIQRDSVGRLDIHELLGQYASEQLTPQEQLDVGNKHCDYYAAFMKSRDDLELGEWHEQALLEIDNIRAFWNWAIDHEMVLAIQKSYIPLFFLYWYQGWALEVRERFKQVVDAFREEVPSREKGILVGACLLNLSWFMVPTSDDEDKALAYAREGYALVRKLGDKADIALANLTYNMCDWALSEEEKIELMEESIAISREFENPYTKYPVEGRAFGFLGDIAFRLSEFEKAEDYYRQAIHLLEAENYYGAVSECYRGLGTIALQKEDYSQAQSFYQEALSCSIQSGYQSGARNILQLLATAALASEDFHKSQEYAEKGLVIDQSTGNPEYIADRLQDLGMVAYELGNLKKAERYYHESLKMFEELENQWAVGVMMSYFGELSLSKGEFQKARSYHLDALKAGLDFEKVGLGYLEHFSFTRLIPYLVSVGKRELAVELATYVLDIAKILAYMKVRTRKQLSVLKDEMPEVIFEAAQARGRKREAITTAEELIELLEDEGLVDRAKDTH
jgi:predicted ATPase/Tfp pilus assembly protein PilF